MKLFKSAWFKCITTLLLIILVSGVGIAVLSFLWEVSPEERTGRALQKIYGRQVLSSEYVVEFDRETMTDKDGKYTFDFGVIDKVIIDSYDKQTLMSQLGASYVNGFLIDISNDYDTYFYSKENKNVAEQKLNPVTGATKSAQAGCNAVNCVIEFMKGVN